MAYDRCESLQGSSSRRRSKGRQSGYEPHKRGLNTKIHLAVDSSGMPVRAIITEGTRADCKEAIHLIEGIDAQNLLADRGYDTSEIIAFALSTGINVVIPPKKNRKVQREYDRYLYKIRHLVENAFLWLKRWRGIATRYAKKVLSRVMRKINSVTYEVGSAKAEQADADCGAVCRKSRILRQEAPPCRQGRGCARTACGN